MLNAVIYVRVSSRRQEEEGNGLESQERICRQFASNRGLVVSQVFSDTYSGGSTDRPGLKALLKLVGNKAGGPYVIVFDDMSRLNRDLRGHLDLVQTLRDLGCLLMSPSREFKDDADSILVENLLAATAEHQRSKNREQVLRRMKGRLLGGHWPFKEAYGYKRIREGGEKKLVADGIHFRIVKEALTGFATA